MLSINKSILKSNLRRHVIIIGSSITGLLCARVVSQYFEKCTILETDLFNNTHGERKGVPQSTQSHILLAKGYRIIEKLFPEIGKNLKDAGALEIDWCCDFNRYDSIVGWNATSKIPSKVRSYTCSRLLLESVIRDRVKSIQNIEILQNHKAVGLLNSNHSSNISGLKILCDKNEITLDSDLIIDASGRKSQIKNWLNEFNYSENIQIVDPKLGYATRKYILKSKEDWKIILVSHCPPEQTKLGYLARIENGEFILTLGGYNKDYPPNDEIGFLEFTKNLTDPKIYNEVKNAKAISQIILFRATKNRKHIINSIPNGIVRIGDCILATNPVYGQGMTISAISAITLKEWLNKSHKTKQLNSLKFQKKLDLNTNSFWIFATTMDLAFSKTLKSENVVIPKKKKNLFEKIIKIYMKKLTRGTSYDSSLNTIFMEVFHSVKSPLILFNPLIILKVIKGKY